ncbi:MAG: tubulin-like doman-containing protein [Pirellulaceae bacterium]
MSSTNSQSLQPDQRVLDYVLKERIGTGGYGEVWSVEAPGGMLKAAKFIYGFHDEKRAQRELKALDRIKHIRHPFLLSLERIDVVDGRLIVISELADMCLKKRFNQCLEHGQPGIEREELLRYMSESADALDYIAESHSLVHLDIKPENLLLVGGHAMVADFGLVKDLKAVNQSLMDGLTPAYAAPELFDGQPGQASDQYSLAIVYQEMLTATRPFSGTTAAQLANQHLHSRPNLNELPRSDQAVIARALSKDPAKRYPDCRSFVEELAKRKNRMRRKSSDEPKGRLENINTQDATAVDVDIHAIKPDVTMTISESVVPAVKFEGEVDKLEPFALDESNAEIRPTLFVGVGSTGARVLCKLRRRLNNRYGSPEGIPALRLLCIDVDRRAMFDATLANEQGSLQSHELLSIPLRKPEEYRNDKELDVSWIGRRWIYNIPKTSLTESLRPLGRLAYVDHHEAIYTRVSDELAKLALPENLALTAETTELSPSSLTPQVVFVGSVAGGLGSGMLLDLAYTTRVVMGELGLTDDHLYGLFSHSTSRNAGDHRLAIANSYSFLNEMYHYNLNGYPGSDACRIPAFEDTSVFDGTYFVHLGDDLQQDEFDRAVDGMAEYLYLSLATRCTSFFDQCRSSSEFEPGMLKTMSTSFVSRGKEAISNQAVRWMAAKMLGEWLDPDENDEVDRQKFETQAHDLLNGTIFGSNRLATPIQAIVEENLGGEPVNELLRLIDESLRNQSRKPKSAIKFAEQVLNQKLGINTDERFDSLVTKDPALGELIDSRIPVIARRSRAEIADAVFELIDDPQYRLAGATAVTESVCNTLQVLAVAIQRRKVDLQLEIESCEQQLKADLENNADADTEGVALKHISRLVSNRVELLVETFKRKLVQLTRNELLSIVHRIAEYSQSVELVRSQIQLPADVSRIDEEQAPNENDMFELLVENVTQQAHSWYPELEACMSNGFLKSEGGLYKILQQGGPRLRQLPNVIMRVAHNLACEKLQEMRLDTMLVETNLPADSIAAWVNELVRPAMPALYKCGGTSRLLIAVPQKAPIATLASFVQNQLDHEANIIPCTCGEFTICMEMDQMPAENVAMTILQMQPDCAELIERLHCRNDIEWTSLTPLC